MSANEDASILTSDRVLGTASSLLTTLNNPLNVTLLTSQILSAPAIWAVPEGLQTCMRCMGVFHSAAQALVRHELASHDKSPDRDFSKLQLERTLPKDDWIRAVAKGADEHSPRWRHLLALGGLLIGFGPAENESLSRGMRSTLEQGFVHAINLALEDVVEEDHFSQQAIALVLNYCFPLLSDVERSQIDFDQLLPVLMRSTFRNMDGLGSTYFLGAIDIDVEVTPEQQYRWPDKAPSFQGIQRTLASPLVSSLGSLARLIGHTLEQVRAPWLVSSAVEDLEDFTRTLHLQWRQNKLSTVDASEEQQRLDPGTLHTTDLLWRLLRSTMYAAVIVLRSAIGRVLADAGLADDEAASNIAIQTLNSLRNLYFVSTRSGSATFSQYTFVYLTAIDILSSYPDAAQAYLQDVRPTEAGKVPQLPLDRNLDLFFLNTSEHLTLALPPAVAENLLVNSAAPYLASASDANLLSIFEAAHSIMLAVFSAPQNANIANRHLPFYVDALFRVFPDNLSARQFRVAFKTLIQITSPPSPLSISQPELPSILLELLFDRVKHATTMPLGPRSTDSPATGDDVLVSEQATIVLTVIDILTQLSLDLLDEWLPIAADMINTIDDANMREHCREHFWLTLIDGAMDPERSRVCHAWWSSAGGRDHVLFGRESAELVITEMSGALPAAEGTSKL
jgi:hypothetical protein